LLNFVQKLEPLLGLIVKWNYIILPISYTFVKKLLSNFTAIDFDMKRIVNFLLTVVISYCLSAWMLFGLAIVLGVDPKAYWILGIVISSLVAIGMGVFIWNKVQPAKCEVSYDEKSSFVSNMNTCLEGLGFEAKSLKDNKLKYQSFDWLSLIDPKINVRLKDNKAIIKGRKRDVENLMNKINTPQAA
jgi:hypothetical protein